MIIDLRAEISCMRTNLESLKLLLEKEVVERKKEVVERKKVMKTANRFKFSKLIRVLIVVGLGILVSTKQINDNLLALTNLM